MVDVENFSLKNLIHAHRILIDSLKEKNKKDNSEQIKYEIAWHEVVLRYLYELEHYKCIGTVKDFIKAKSKQEAKEPQYFGDSCDENGEVIYDTWICPNCDTECEIDFDRHEYCPCCGQHIKLNIIDNEE